MIGEDHYWQETDVRDMLRWPEYHRLEYHIKPTGGLIKGYLFLTLRLLLPKYHSAIITALEILSLPI